MSNLIDTLIRTQQARTQSADQGVQQGLSGLYNHFGREQEIQRQDKLRKEDYDRQQAELNRPVAAPVQSLLESLTAKVNNQEMPGRLAAKLYKMVQKGLITEDDAKAHADAGTMPGAMSGPHENGAHPIPVEKPLTINSLPEGFHSDPEVQKRMPPGTPTPMGPQIAPSNVPMPPRTDAASSMQQAPVSPAPTQQPHRWTVRDVNDLSKSGVSLQPKGKSEMDFLMDFFKQKTITDNNIRNNDTSRANTRDNNAGRDRRQEKELTYKAVKLDQDLDIALARLEAMANDKSFKAGQTRDVELMKAAEKELIALEKTQSDLQRSLGAMVNDPESPVALGMQDVATKIVKARQLYDAYRQRVEKRDGLNQPSVEGTSTTTVTPNGMVPNGNKPPVADFVKALRGE